MGSNPKSHLSATGFGVSRGLLDGPRGQLDESRSSVAAFSGGGAVAEAIPAAVSLKRTKDASPAPSGRSIVAVFLDIGAGISFNIADFFLLAEAGLLVVVPEPSSIENAYRFLKMSFYRHLWSAVKGSGVRAVIEEAMDEKNRQGIRTPFDLLEAVEKKDQAAGQALKARAKSFRPRLIINQVRYPEDERLGPSMASVCRKHLGIEVECLGAIQYEDVVWQANRRKKPFMLVFPDSEAGQSLERAAVNLLRSSNGHGANGNGKV